MSRLLCVEDDRHVALLLEFALDPLQLTLETIGDGRAAVARLRQTPVPDALILDISLPGLSGLEILEWMQEDPALAAIPVLVLSAGQRREDRDRVRGIRTCLFMQKPFDVDQLRRVVGDLLRGAATAPESSE